ncbi:hypothetical protein Pla110_22500 [Polystyrenella longa]|uniref:DUF4291 domain-containing protein n=1 Tax=Polystyrenella longa TaxID=2528007 RepID=A0A518CMS1_9PLAN|nr:DUF4291 domain-containing protein [Polystyrenella longa]QDU80520.1 hypothetical protein Pla110_22500 [Polystyrenella longa]
MKLPTERYLDQKRRWPSSGKHILASFDDDTIWVYQAYSPKIGLFAASNGYFGGEFRYSRMSWIKPNFLWMMYRSNWGQSSGQKVVLGIRLNRDFFDSILNQAVPSSFKPEQFVTHEAWKSALSQSEVRLQWDPDHLPNGDKEERKAIQLGLRGETLEAYGKREIVEIVDMSEFVAGQRANASGERFDELITPLERPYLPSKQIRTHLGLETS